MFINIIFCNNNVNFLYKQCKYTMLFERQKRVRFKIPDKENYTTMEKIVIEGIKMYR